MIVLDRFEGQYAIIEIDGHLITVSRNQIGASAQEGDVLVFISNVYVPDQEATQKRKEALKKRLKKLWET